MRVAALMLAGFLASIAAAAESQAADPIGEAAKVTATLTGPSGPLATGASVYFNDKLATDATGVGQIIFKDGTKLAIGPNAEVTIDKFVYKDDGTFGELAVNMTKGAFRWISGKSKPEAYKLSTGWANLAIRGTAFDVTVDPAGELTLVLYEGEVTVCLAIGECRTLQGQCRYIASETRIDVSDPEALGRATARQLKQSGRLPFLDNDRLIRPFHVKNGSCKVRKTNKQRKAQRTIRTKRAQKATKTKTATLAARPAIASTVGARTLGKKGRTTASPDPVSPNAGDPSPGETPGKVDTPTSTDEGPTGGSGTPGKKGHHGRKGHGRTGNPGNDGDNGHAGEDPGGGDFGGGNKGKGDTHGKGGRGGGRGHGKD
ncbi:MAG: FecR domain-containing protein [Hyphomicrobiaceae bacterium]